MSITSLDILNLSHSLKDVCEVHCKSPECSSLLVRSLLEYNLVRANLEFARQFQEDKGSAPPSPKPDQQTPNPFHH